MTFLLGVDIKINYMNNLICYVHLHFRVNGYREKSLVRALDEDTRVRQSLSKFNSRGELCPPVGTLSRLVSKEFC